MQPCAGDGTDEREILWWVIDHCRREIVLPTWTDEYVTYHTNYLVSQVQPCAGDETKILDYNNIMWLYLWWVLQAIKGINCEV